MKYQHHFASDCLIGCCMCVLLVSCGPALTKQGAQTGASRNVHTLSSSYPPIHIGVQVDLAVLPTLCSAALVADVTVSRVGPSRWNTPDGMRPAANPFPADSTASPRYYIYTLIQFSHMHIYADHRRHLTTQYVMLGGQVGQDTYQVDGYGHVEAGRRYLVFFGYEALNDTHMLQIIETLEIDAHGMIKQFNPAYANKVGQDTPNEMMDVPLAQVLKKRAKC